MLATMMIVAIAVKIKVAIDIGFVILFLRYRHSVTRQISSDNHGTFSIYYDAFSPLKFLLSAAYALAIALAIIVAAGAALILLYLGLTSPTDSGNPTLRHYHKRPPSSSSTWA